MKQNNPIPVDVRDPAEIDLIGLPIRMLLLPALLLLSLYCAVLDWCFDGCRLLWAVGYYLRQLWGHLLTGELR